MHSRPVPPEYLTAGREYLEALMGLGLFPHYLGWGWRRADEQWELVLATSIVDAGGPLALNRLLFKAYNANATPQEISPFMVRVLSPEIMPQEMKTLALGPPLSVWRQQPGTKLPGGEPISIENFRFTFLGIDFELVNSYRVQRPDAKEAFMERRKAWDRFKKNVEKLAA